MTDGFNWNKFLRELYDARLATPRTLRGCTEAEIVSLEKSNGVLLPGIYREFLGLMGHGTGAFLNDGDYWFYEDLDEIQPLAREMSEGYFSLPKDAFAISMMDSGQQCRLNHCRGEYDPPVYHYIECHREWTVRANSFSTLLGQIASEEAALVLQGYLQPAFDWRR